jgi:hypothetical protein
MALAVEYAGRRLPTARLRTGEDGAGSGASTAAWLAPGFGADAIFCPPPPLLPPTSATGKAIVAGDGASGGERRKAASPSACTSAEAANAA